MRARALDKVQLSLKYARVGMGHLYKWVQRIRHRYHHGILLIQMLPEKVLHQLNHSPVIVPLKVFGIFFLISCCVWTYGARCIGLVWGNICWKLLYLIATTSSVKTRHVNISHYISMHIPLYDISKTIENIMYPLLSKTQVVFTSNWLISASKSCTCIHEFKKNIYIYIYILWMSILASTG